LLAGCSELPTRRPEEERRFYDVPAMAVSVVDGDTIQVRRPDGTDERVRYAGAIDAPERCEPAGAEATRLNAALTDQQAVTLRVDTLNERDRSGRLLAYVFVGDRLVQRELLLAGMATNRFREVARNPWQAEWDGWERQAWTERRGLWGTYWAAFSPDNLPPRAAC
jgi:micrococcal nuclease